VNDASGHVKNVAFTKSTAPVLVQFLEDLFTRKVTAWLQVKKLAILLGLEQVPVFLAFKLKQKGIDVVVVRCKALLLLACILKLTLFDSSWIRSDVRVDTCITLEDLVAQTEHLRQARGELMRSRQSDAALLVVEEVEQQVGVHGTHCWVNRVPLTVNELHDINVFSIL